jgi:hypothetical protein
MRAQEHCRLEQIEIRITLVQSFVVFIRVVLDRIASWLPGPGAARPAENSSGDLSQDRHRSAGIATPDARLRDGLFRRSAPERIHARRFAHLARTSSAHVRQLLHDFINLMLSGALQDFVQAVLVALGLKQPPRLIPIPIDEHDRGGAPRGRHAATVPTGGRSGQSAERRSQRDRSGISRLRE